MLLSPYSVSSLTNYKGIFLFSALKPGLFPGSYFVSNNFLTDLSFELPRKSN